MRIIKLALCITALAGCSVRHVDTTSQLEKIQIIDHNGFSEMISNKDKVRALSKVDFTKNQPYQQVTRVYSHVDGKKRVVITSYFSNGLIKEYLEAIDGQADGIYQSWHSNGVEKIRSQIKGGVPNFSTKAKTTWQFDGQALVWNERGQIEAKIMYNHGKLDGDTIHYWAPDHIKKKLHYKNGYQDGWQYEYYKDGQLQKKSYYTEGVQDGVYEAYFKDGTEQSMELWLQGLLKRGHYYDRSGALASMVEEGDGIKTEWTSQGLKESTYQKGKIDGKVTLYNQEGVLIEYYHQKNGRKHGERKLFYTAPFQKTSQPKISMYFVEGVLQGPSTSWYESGQVQSKFEMSQNEKHGLAAGYYEDGAPMYLEKYVQGKLLDGKYFKKSSKDPVSEVKDGTGTATLFDVFGNVQKQVEYDKGSPALR